MGLRQVFVLLAMAAPVQAASLYERLGGKPGVAAVVDDLFARAAADKRLKGRFLDVDRAHVQTALAEVLCAKSGGGCAAQDLRAAIGQQIVDAEWQALLEDLDGALQKVGPGEKQELLNLWKPLAAEVIQPPPPEALKLDGELAEKARQLASMLDNVGKLKAGELLELAVTARVRGQRSYAEYLYSLAELQLKPGSLAVIAPLFRQGGPPRITDKTQIAQPIAGSDDDDTKGRASLQAVLTVEGKPRLGVLTLAGGKRRPPTSYRPPQAKRAQRLEIRGGQLSPHVVVVPVGSTVSFANFDPIYHNWFSLSPVKPFDLGLYKNGELREVTFDKEGVVRVSCNLHPHTAAYVIVVSAPYFAVSDGEGQLTLKGVAPGRYQANLWSEGAEVTRAIEIHPGENHLTLDAKSAPEPAITDKFGL